MITEIAFYKAEYGDWKDRVVSLGTRGPYSHCEINICGEGFSASPREGNVRFKDIDVTSGHGDVIKCSSRYTQGEMINLSVNELNKGYDGLGIFLSHLFPFNRHDKDKWFCSEICAYLLGFDKPHIYDPNSLYNVLSA